MDRRASPTPTAAEQHSRDVARAAERLHLTPEQAARWLSEMSESENGRELIDVVVNGALIENGRIYFPGQ